MQAELIKNSSTTQYDFEIVELRQNFVNEYCMSKGWDKQNLDFEQILEIRSHIHWKNPYMLKG